MIDNQSSDDDVKKASAVCPCYPATGGNSVRVPMAPVQSHHASVNLKDLNCFFPFQEGIGFSSLPSARLYPLVKDAVMGNAKVTSLLCAGPCTPSCSMCIPSERWDVVRILAIFMTIFSNHPV